MKTWLKRWYLVRLVTSSTFLGFVLVLAMSLGLVALAACGFDSFVSNQVHPLASLGLPVIVGLVALTFGLIAIAILSEALAEARGDRDRPVVPPVSPEADPLDFFAHTAEHACEYDAAFASGDAENLRRAAALLIPADVVDGHVEAVGHLQRARAHAEARRFLEARQAFAHVRETLIPSFMRAEFRRERSEVCRVIAALDHVPVAARERCTYMGDPQRDFFRLLYCTFDGGEGADLVTDIVSEIATPTALEMFLSGLSHERMGRIDKAYEAYNYSASFTDEEAGPWAAERLDELRREGHRAHYRDREWPERLVGDLGPSQREKANARVYIDSDGIVISREEAMRRVDATMAQMRARSFATYDALDEDEPIEGASRAL